MYAEPVLTKLIEVLNAAGPGALRNKYFIGDPVIPPLDDLPMCFVSKDATTVTPATNLEDWHIMPIALNVVYAGLQDLNDGSFAQAGAVNLYEICEGRETDYTIRTDTIVGVIRANQVLDGPNKLYIDIESADTTVEYILSPPPRRGYFSVEAIIRTTLKQMQLRP